MIIRKILNFLTQSKMISFIIITRNKREFLERTLKTVYKNKKEKDEIIIIDDESTDGTMNMIEKHFQDIRYKRIKHKGYTLARMRNIGIKMAKFNRLVLMDDDLLLPDGYIDDMKKYYGPKTLVTGKFKREKENGELEEDWRLTNAGIRKSEIEKDVYRLLKDENDEYFLRGVCGVIMISKKFTKEIGYYNTDFDGKWGAEDSFFGIKWAYYGGDVIYMAKMTAIHQYHLTNNIKKQEEKIENRKLLQLMVKKLRNPKIAIIIHTFLRDDVLKKCVNSIKGNLTDYNYRIYISDGGNMTPEKKEYYKELKSNGHFIMELPFDTNWPAARNKIIKNVKESYVLYLDDDFILNDETNLDPMIKILDSNAKIGIVGGKVIKGGAILQYNFNVAGKPGELKYHKINNETVDETVGEYKYHYCDVMPNFWMAKKEIFDSGVKWDDELNVGGGHSDFFLNIKFNTKWKVVYNNDCHIYHEHEGTLEYHRKRKRKEWSRKFISKWNSGNTIDIDISWDKEIKEIIVEEPVIETLCEKDKIDFLIKTFERPGVLEALLLSIAKFYPEAHISIADDSKEFRTEFYKKLWVKLEGVGLKNRPVAYNLPFDTGLSYGRNFLVDHTDGEYILILDDDFIFTEDTKIEKFKDILQAKKDVGIVGGMIVQDGTERHFEGNIEIVGRDMIYSIDKEGDYQNLKGIKYRETGCVFNFALMKREIFEEIKWDDKFKIAGEHTDWYLRFNDLNWKVAYCPEVKIEHRQEFNPVYKEMRKRKDFLKLLFKKYKCDRLIYSTGLCYEYVEAEDIIMNYRVQPINK